MKCSKGSGVDLALSGVTLTGGIASSGGNTGGAIWIGGGASLTLIESALINNSAASVGGAIRNQGTVEIYGSILEGNTGSRGGGIYADTGSVVLGNSIVAQNTATSALAIQNGDEDDIFSIPSVFDSYGNNLLTSIRSNLPTEVGDVENDPQNLFVVTTVADGLDPNDGGVSLREAFNSANAKDVNQVPINGTVWLPPWRHRLTRIDNPDTAADNDVAGDVDLTVTGNVEIVGAGAGLTVIDASGLGERIFDVRSGLLDISRVTLTGGDTTSGANGASGGAIWVRGGATLNLSDSAVVGNTAGGNGGGIFSQGTTTITNSVITENTAAGTGGLHVTGAAGITTTVGGTIIANNSSAGSMDDVYKSMSVTLASSGNNLLTSDDSGVFNQTGDLIGTVDHVVTSVIDSYRHSDDNFALSVREAVDLANQSNGLSEVWMPAWDFLLTRQRDYNLQLADTDVSYGDIDISESIVLRGIAGETTIDWLSAIEIPNNNRDKIFDLLGSTADGTADATASGAGFLIWQQEFGSGVGNPEYEEFLADFDDDGDVDGDDQDAVWQQYYGNTLDLEGLTVLS